ncbi:MAG: hypothetical protein IJB80_00010 [Clostridia bacterium]|nr:hypothetical protein [Clostridia bacterium]
MIKIEKAPEGAYLSDQYDVFVKKEGTECAVDAYLALVSEGNGLHKIPDELRKEFDEIEEASFVTKGALALFEADEEVCVTVRVSQSTEIIEVMDKPFERSGDRVSFLMKPGEVATVKVNGLFDHCLRVICNTISVPKKDNENFIEFKPGYYSIENCEYITAGKKGFPVIADIPDNTTIYIHYGAVVNAAFVLENKRHIKICGGGIISTMERCYGADVDFEKTPLYGPLRRYAYPSVFIKTNSSHITVEGVTLNSEFRGVVIRNSEDVAISNIKVFTNCINADGINLMNARRIKIEDSFIHSHDDGVAVFTSCDSILYLGDEECENPLPVSSDIEVANCEITTTCRPFVIGGHATGGVAPHDRVERFYAHDSKVINYRYYDFPETERVKKWSGFLRILSQTEQLISDIRFQNIRCVKRTDYEGQPIHIELRGSNGASYSERGGYRIEKLMFDNIFFQEQTEIDLPSAIYNTADNTQEDYCVDGVVFKDVYFGSTKMENTEKYLEKIGVGKNILVQ